MTIMSCCLFIFCMEAFLYVICMPIFFCCCQLQYEVEPGLPSRNDLGASCPAQNLHQKTRRFVVCLYALAPCLAPYLQHNGPAQLLFSSTISPKDKSSVWMHWDEAEFVPFLALRCMIFAIQQTLAVRGRGGRD